MTIRIYVLIDPRDGRARYVGKTSTSLSQRLSVHTAHREPASAKDIWIAGLRRLGLVPLIEEVDAFSPAEKDSMEEEAFWVRFYRAEGYPLLNERGWGSLGTDRRVFSADEKAALFDGKMID